MVARASHTFETPEMDKIFRITQEGDEAKVIFVEFATRTGKFTKDLIARKIWEKHELPMYRGTIVEEVPFRLRIDQILFNFKEYKITCSYHFVSED